MEYVLREGDSRNDWHESRWGGIYSWANLRRAGSGGIGELTVESSLTKTKMYGIAIWE